MAPTDSTPTVDWATLAAAFEAYASDEHHLDDVAELIASTMWRYLTLERRARFFAFWQERGFHVMPVSFYSPIPDTRALPPEVWSQRSAMPGIDLNDKVQLALL